MTKQKGQGNKILVHTKNNPQQICTKSVGHEPMNIQYKVHPLTWPSEKATEKSVCSDLATVNIIQHSSKLLTQIQAHFTPFI